MKHKRIRLVLFSAWGSDYRESEHRVTAFISMILGAMLCFMLIGAGLLIGSKHVFQYFYVKLHERKEGVMRVQFSLWQAQTESLARQYASITGIPRSLLFADRAVDLMMDSSETLDGRGGAFVDEEDNIFPSLDDGGLLDGNLYSDFGYPIGTNEILELSPSELINHLESRVSNKKQAYNVISEKFEKRRRELEHKPSVKPILDGRITDFFGRRVDPFVRRIRHHRGLDIAAPRGTQVYAPAAGVIEMAKTRYRINRGYGRVVIINHGYGMKTLYGHLLKVDVKPGQLVKRWDVLGSVGDTGRATGPHLHYEVWVDGKARDPVEFIINE